MQRRAEVDDGQCPFVDELYRIMRFCPDLAEVPDASIVELIRSPEWRVLLTAYKASRLGRREIRHAA